MASACIALTFTRCRHARGPKFLWQQKGGWLLVCKDIIGKLLRNKRAWPFEEPVDPKALKLVCSPPPVSNSRCWMLDEGDARRGRGQYSSERAVIPEMVEGVWMYHDQIAGFRGTMLDDGWIGRFWHANIKT